MTFGVQTFERRMRELVLGNQRQQQLQYQQEQRVVEPDLIPAVRTPSNVKVIQSLQEYKEVVGDEREKLVVVRFFATYCKVSYFRDLEILWFVIEHAGLLCTHYIHSVFL